MAAFWQHNIPFSTMDHLAKLLKESIPDSKIFQKLEIGRPKTTAIIKNMIGAEYKKELTEKLRKVPFSILADKSTDISSEKIFCIMIRYFDKSKNVITTSI